MPLDTTVEINMKTATLITVHGMGRTEKNYADEFFHEVGKRLGTHGKRLHYETVYYQSLLQPNEDRVWQQVGGRLRWDALRKFVLFGFADAAGLENGKEASASVYTLAQVEIARALYSALKSTAQGPVVIIAQSLGGQVVSNYFWDAGNFKASANTPEKRPTCGFWKDPVSFSAAVGSAQALDSSELDFLAGAKLRQLVTTGCNIPVFVAAHARQDILPFDRPNTDFAWHNYYDKDDVLGWPLAELSNEYGKLVHDHRVNAGGGIAGWLLHSWNPASHAEYWGDDEVLDPLVAHLRALL